MKKHPRLKHLPVLIGRRDLRITLRIIFGWWMSCVNESFA